MKRFRVGRPPPMRRGAVVVQVAISLVVMLGFAALAIDIGAMYAVRAELQSAADAAALAAAAELVGDGVHTPESLARAAADEMAARNEVNGVRTGIDEARDVEMGHAELNAQTGRWAFVPGGNTFDSVRVTVRRTDDSEGGALQLGFANIFGRSSKNLSASAAAVLVPRDISVVIDLSGSMNDDSELRHYRTFESENAGYPDQPGVQVNLRDIWCAMNGPQPARPYIPGADSQTEYASDTGPTFGSMTNWGTAIVPETWNPTTDNGLWYIPMNATCSVAAATTTLTSRGYSSDERSILLSGTRDGTSGVYDRRTAVILGLANWRSGRSGGRGGTPAGDGDNVVESNEVTYISYPSWRSGWTWTDYLDYVQTNYSEMYQTDSRLRYRYGLKTFTNFCLEAVSRNDQCTNLWQTPEQPLRAVKDAVRAMADEIIALEGMDHLSLEIFATTARHEVNLSDNINAVPDRLYNMQSAHYDTTTNIGGGLAQAIGELRSSRARTTAHKVIVLMSDGKPNVDENGNYDAGGAAGANYARAQAQLAASYGMRIYTISVGGDSDPTLLAEIASLAQGQHFHAEGTPDEYRDQLEVIFRTLGGRRGVALIE